MNRSQLKLPCLYAIADAGCFASRQNPTAELMHFVAELASGGVTLLQYRNKFDVPREMLSQSRELKRVFGDKVMLIMNDRADLCLAAGFDGLHLGQDDLSPDAARLVIGAEAVLGFSTHNPEQVSEADALPLDYIAVGPVFATSTKANPDPVIGLEGVKTARALTNKPLVAIGGITRANCRSVIDAGADSVAVIADLLTDPRRAAEEFLRMLS
jgi:thiamine-phosphate pyrophosphorylase